ncbi:MAG: type IV pilus biogenesis/stability protein PilW [Pseudomonadota bacterium]
MRPGSTDVFPHRRPSRMACQSARTAAAIAVALGVLTGLAACTSAPRQQQAQMQQPDKEGVPAQPNPDSGKRAAIRLQLAGAYFAEGRVDPALQEVNQALALDSDLAGAHALKALVLDAKGDVAGAEAAFHRAIQLDPRDGATLHNYGWMQCRLQRYDAAARLLDQALAAPGYRGSAQTLMVKGVCEARAGHLEQAEQTLLRAYERDAGNPVTAVNLADVLYRRGELERARFYVRRVNQSADLSNAESLWLALRIERKLGNQQGARDLGSQLLARYPRSREALAYEAGRYEP